MNIRPTDLPDVLLIETTRVGDDRGHFAETFRVDKLAARGVGCVFVQDNQSRSRAAGTVRGLHYQLAPRAQDKLVRVLRGRILDVAVDIRRSSPTFGRHVAVELSADNGLQLLVPAGFAHGFATLEPDTEVFYKVSDYWSRDHERAIRFDDPALGIDWRIDPSSATLSDKDAASPRLADQPNLFD